MSSQSSPCPGLITTIRYVTNLTLLICSLLTTKPHRDLIDPALRQQLSRYAPETDTASIQHARGHGASAGSGGWVSQGQCPSWRGRGRLRLVPAPSPAGLFRAPCLLILSGAVGGVPVLQSSRAKLTVRPEKKKAGGCCSEAAVAVLALQSDHIRLKDESD